METSGYVDIFATKGVEYIFIIGFLLSLILFWKFLVRSKAPERTPAVVSGKPFPALNPWFHLADDCLYHQGHSWARPEENNVFRVGVDDFAQQLLGKPSAVELPSIGTGVEQGEKGWKLRIDSKGIDILSPVEGEVVAVNDEVIRAPYLLNQDPYGSGWLMKVKVPKTKKNVKNLLSGELAMAWMKGTVDALLRKMSGDLGATLQDGGVPVGGIAKALSPNDWEEVAMEFLLSK